MAITPGKIHLGASRAFFGVTAPTTGTPPTLLTHTDGTPGSGSDLGMTEGDTVFHYGDEKKLIEGEQALGYVDARAIAQRGWVELTAKEQTYVTLLAAFGAVGTVTDSNKDLFYFGGGTAVLNPTKGCFVLTARQPAAPTKFIVAVLYRAVYVGSYEVPFSRSKETMYRMKFEGLFDTTRDAGDQLGYYVIEK